MACGWSAGGSVKHRYLTIEDEGSGGKLVALIAWRLALGLLTLLIVSIIISLGVEFLPGDLSMENLERAATPKSAVGLTRGDVPSIGHCGTR